MATYSIATNRLKKSNDDRVALEGADRDADEPDDHDGAEVAGAW